MRPGCLALLAVALLLGGGGASWGIHRLYVQATRDLSVSSALVQECLDHYNRDEFAALYPLCDGTWRQRYSSEQSESVFAQLKRMTGSVSIRARTFFHLQDGAGGKHLTLGYRCLTAGGGNVDLIITMHEQTTWQIQDFAFH